MTCKFFLGLCLVACGMTGCGGDSYADRFEGDSIDPPEDPSLAIIQQHEEKLSDLYSKLEKVESDFHDLKEANASLQSEIDRLQDENWRDVIPDLVVANDEMQSVTIELEDKLSELSSSFYQ